jgi:cytidylate kinase
LTKAVDAIEVITDGLDIDQVIAKIISLYERLS